MNEDWVNDWILVASTGAIGPGEVIEVECTGRRFAVYHLGDAIYVTASECPRDQARLCEGRLEADLIECPTHHGRFHVPSGEERGEPPGPALRIYPVMVVDEEIFVNLPVRAANGAVR